MKRSHFHVPKSALMAMIFTGLSGILGCDNREIPAQAFVVIDSGAQAVTVTNGGSGRWSPTERWRISEDFRIGGREGLLLSNALTGVSLGPTGHIYILDFPARELVAVDGDGTNPELVAGRGPGPGEIEFAGGMGWDERDRLWIADGRGRYSTYDSIGRFIMTAERPIHGLVRRQFPLVFADDKLIDEAPTSDGVLFLRVDPESGSIDSLTSLAVAPSDDLPRLVLRPSQRNVRFVLNHYRPKTVWAVTAAGTVWAARTDSLRLYQIDLESGDTIRIVDTNHRISGGLSEEDEELIREAFAEIGIDPGLVQLSRPVLQSLQVTQDGYILAQIVDEVGKDGNTFDVFNPDGVFMGTVTTPFRLARHSQPSIVGDTFVAVALGPHDEPYVVRSTILRSAAANPGRPARR